MPPSRLRLIPLAFVSCLVLPATLFSAEPDSEKTALAVEALSRLPQTDLNSNPKLKETVLRLLERTRGTPHFVKLVQKFQIPDQNAGLLEVAINRPADESGVQATRLLLAGGGAPQIEQSLGNSNVLAATHLAEALGNTGEKPANQLLLPLLNDAKKDPALRRQAVRSLAKSADGSRELLRLAREDKLATDLRFTASTELNHARWPEIKDEAGKVLPLATGANAQALPPLTELLQRTGDIANGARLFTNASPGCSSCHVVRGYGTELGPNLSEIGTKLGKDALYEAILEPSSGISFGYEAYNFTLKNGDEAYGLIASETADEVAVKTVGGFQSKLKKSDIASRQISKLSLMPSGLQAALSPQDLVDLVEYLASLKKP